MPQGVVDLLEAVQVEPQHRDFPSIPLRPQDGLLDAVLKQQTVGQSGQHVVLGLERQTFIQQRVFNRQGGHLRHLRGHGGRHAFRPPWREKQQHADGVAGHVQQGNDGFMQTRPDGQTRDLPALVLTQLQSAFDTFESLGSQHVGDMPRQSGAQIDTAICCRRRSTGQRPPRSDTAPAFPQSPTAFRPRARGFPPFQESPDAAGQVPWRAPARDWRRQVCATPDSGPGLHATAQHNAADAEDEQGQPQHAILQGLVHLGGLQSGMRLQSLLEAAKILQRGREGPRSRLLVDGQSFP